MGIQLRTTRRFGSNLASNRSIAHFCFDFFCFSQIHNDHYTQTETIHKFTKNDVRCSLRSIWFRLYILSLDVILQALGVVHGFSSGSENYVLKNR